MRPFEVAKNVYWVGALHPQLKLFDDLVPTRRGTTYNAYLLRGQRNVLIDAVRSDFADVLLRNIAAILDPKSIDVIVVNHTEPDHSSSLAALLEVARGARVLSSKAGKLYLQDMLNRRFDSCITDDCQEVQVAGGALRFISAPFMHWPDSIFTWLPEQGILFSCDAFGSHFCDERMYDDLVDDFQQDFRLYYDTLMRPYRDKVLAALERLGGLDIRMICPGHGPILRTNPRSYIEKYRQWATLKPRQRPYIAIIYVSAHGNTARMAQAIAEGIRRLDVDVDLLHATEVDEERLRTALENADGLLFGSPTIVRDLPPPMWRVLSLLSTVKLQARRAAAFGSYGWSGEVVRMIEERLREMRLLVATSNLRFKFVPTEKDLEACRDFGEEFAAEVVSG